MPDRIFNTIAGNTGDFSADLNLFGNCFFVERSQITWAAMDWMDTNISRRLYSIHNQIGGVGWDLTWFDYRVRVTIEDEELRNTFCLKFL